MRKTKAAGALVTALLATAGVPALAQDSIPVEEVRQSVPLSYGPQVVALRLDMVGLGPAFVGSLGPAWSWNLFGTAGETFDFDLFKTEDERDVVKQYEVGAQLRWHLAGTAPAGTYVFGELVYLNGKFKRSDQETGRTASHIERGGKPAIGVGYSGGGSTVVWDVGIGLRDDIEYSADYSDGGHFDSSRGGMFYATLGVRL